VHQHNLTLQLNHTHLC